jgi:hypothetical protein
VQIHVLFSFSLYSEIDTLEALQKETNKENTPSSSSGSCSTQTFKSWASMLIHNGPFKPTLTPTGHNKKGQKRGVGGEPHSVEVV